MLVKRKTSCRGMGKPQPALDILSSTTTSIRCQRGRGEGEGEGERGSASVRARAHAREGHPPQRAQMRTSASVVPPFLHRAAQAKARSRSEAAAQAKTQRTKPGTQPTIAQTNQRTSKPDAKQTNRSGRPEYDEKGGVPARGDAGRTAPAGGLDFEALADAVVSAAARQDAARALRPTLPSILQTVVAGAHLKGPSGMGDRGLLLRLMGIPLASAADTAARAGVPADVPLRLSAAHTRRVRLLAVIDGDEPGTPAPPTVETTASDAADAA